MPEVFESLLDKPIVVAATESHTTTVAAPSEPNNATDRTNAIAPLAESSNKITHEKILNLPSYDSPPSSQLLSSKEKVLKRGTHCMDNEFKDVEKITGYGSLLTEDNIQINSVKLFIPPAKKHCKFSVTQQNGYSRNDPVNDDGSIVNEKKKCSRNLLPQFEQIACDLKQAEEQDNEINGKNEAPDEESQAPDNEDGNDNKMNNNNNNNSNMVTDTKETDKKRINIIRL